MKVWTPDFFIHGRSVSITICLICRMFFIIRGRIIHFKLPDLGAYYQRFQIVKWDFEIRHYGLPDVEVSGVYLPSTACFVRFMESVNRLFAPSSPPSENSHIQCKHSTQISPSIPMRLKRRSVIWPERCPPRSYSENGCPHLTQTNSNASIVRLNSSAITIVFSPAIIAYEIYNKCCSCTELLYYKYNGRYISKQSQPERDYPERITYLPINKPFFASCISYSGHTNRSHYRYDCRQQNNYSRKNVNNHLFYSQLYNLLKNKFLIWNRVVYYLCGDNAIRVSSFKNLVANPCGCAGNSADIT